MGRDMLRVDGVTPEVKQQLQAAALALYGKPNASLLVRALIAEHLAGAARGHTSATTSPQQLDSDSIRVQLRLPRAAVVNFEELAERQFSPRSYYITSVLLAHLGRQQLQGDEIETLRRSNYELSKIGTNLNQIARAFNILVKSGEGGRLPELGKRIAALRKDISLHTGKVLKALQSGSAAWDNRGREQRKMKLPKSR